MKCNPPAIVAILVLAVTVAACAAPPTPVPPTPIPPTAAAVATAGPPATTAPTQPAATQPPPTQPAATKPAATQPVATQPAATKAGAKTVTVGIWQEPTVMSPYWNTLFMTTLINRMHNRGLWDLDANDNAFAALAEAMPTAQNGGIAADGKTLTVKLRKNIRWTDGVPFTSKDVVFTWQQVMNPKNTVASRAGYDLISAIDSPDDYTVVIKMKEPYAGWVNLFRQGMLPEHTLKGKESLDKDPYLMAPIGTGPYKLVEWKQGDHVTFDRFDGFYGQKAKLDRIYIKFIPSTDAAIAALKVGDVDIAVNLAETDIPTLKNLEPKVHLVTRALGRFEVTYFNLDPKMGPSLFQDQNVRKAIVLGFDRVTLVNKLLGGLTTVPNGPWANTPWENKDVKPLPYDSAQAKKILDDAGWKVGPDGIRVKTIDGNQVRLSFKHAIGLPNPLRSDVQLLFQQNMRDIGVDVVIANLPSAQVAGGTYQSGAIAPTGKYESYEQFMDYFPDPDPRDTMLCSGVATDASPAGNNWSRVCDKTLDELVTKQRSIGDPVERKKVFDQIQAYLAEKVYLMPMFNRLGVWGAADRVKNLKPGWWGDIFWNTEDWDVSG